MNPSESAVRQRSLWFLAVMAFVTWGLAVVPTLWMLHADPAANLGQPVHSLFVVSEASRRTAQGASPWEPPWWNSCDTCSEPSSRRTWDSFMELSTARGDMEATSEARVARNVALAGWGDGAAREELERLSAEEVTALPTYLSARVREVRSGAFDVAEWPRTCAVLVGQWTYRAVLTSVMIVGLLLLFSLRAPRAAEVPGGDRPRGGATERTLPGVGLAEGFAILFFSFGFAHSVWPGFLAAFGDVPGVWPLLPLVPALPLLWHWSWRFGAGSPGAALRAAFFTLFGVGPRSSFCSGRHALVRVFVAVWIGLALDLASTELAEAVAFSLDWTWRWTDGVDERVFFGDGRALTVTFVEAVLLAPLVEELLFRGVLFAALRRRWSFWVAGPLSATVFASLHGYGLAGLLCVACAGVVFAWLYEKTGSLLSSFGAHALANAAALWGAWLLRP